MANTVQIIISAVDKASATFKTVNKSIADTSKTTGSFSDKLASASTSIAAVAAGAAGVVGAVIGIGAALKSVSDNFMDYALQVRDFGNIIGATPEQASQLIQVADDVRVSFEQLGTAMKAAILRGYAPTIEGLSAMSDAYLKIQDPIERSKFLLDTFGRSGLEMARLMELGGDAIVEMGKKIEGTGLEISEADIQSATDYYNAIDEAGDAWEALKQNLGKEVAPVIVEIIYKVTDWQQELAAQGEALKKLQDAVNQGAIEQGSDLYNMIGRVIEMADGAADAIYMIDKAWQDYYASLGLTDAVLQGIADGMDMVGASGEEAGQRGAAAWKAYQEELAKTKATDMSAHSNELDDIAKAAVKAATTVIQVKSALEKLNSVDVNFGDDIMDQLDKIDWTRLGGPELEAARDRIEDQFNRTGDIDQFEQNMKDLAVAVEGLKMVMGSTTKPEIMDTLRESGQYTEEELDKISKLLDEIKTKGSFDATFYLHGIIDFTTRGGSGGGGGRGGSGTGPPVAMEALGGMFTVPPGYPNDSYRVQMSSGEHVQVTPAGSVANPAGMAGGGGGITVNINGSSGDPMQIANTVIMEINRRMSNARRSGMGYTGA